ncbi:MAG: prophage antirepressor-like protein [Cocleimonas sp.]|jgi:prophage antirepressor-like protein
MSNNKPTHIEHLCFDNTPIAVIEHDNAPWFTSAEIAKALGYSSPKSITTIYNRNEIEFDNTDSTVISVMTSTDSGGYRRTSTRIFSQDGCNLVAMLAKGPRAITFRRWVKKVLRDFRFRANGATEEIADEVEENFSYHMLVDQMPTILNIPSTFNATEMPFTFVNNRLWLNSYDLGTLLELTTKRPGQKITEVWKKYQNDMPEDGSRLTNWSRVGRGTGERVYDLPTCIAIADYCYDSEVSYDAILFLMAVRDHMLLQQQSVDKSTLLQKYYQNEGRLQQVIALNNILGENELGDKAHGHQVMNDLLMQISAKNKLTLN